MQRKLALPCPTTEAKKALMFFRPLLMLPAAMAMLLSHCAFPASPAVMAAARQHGLVDVRAAIPGIGVDLRYRTRRNVTGRPLYPRNMPCLLRASTAERLKQAQATLRAQGYGLLIWDAWRPTEVHQQLFASGSHHPGMFQDPDDGWSRHCGGVSVDATLVDAAGRELKMPTYFDENFERAASDLRPQDPVVRQNLHILHSAMRSAGLVPLPSEWWHFDDIDFLHNPVLVIKGKAIGISVR